MRDSKMAPIMRPMISAALLALSMPASTAMAQDIGTIALSVAQVTGTPPNAAPRALQIGSPVVLDEQVATGAASRAEVLFRDQTSLSLGANTAVVLDRFVFDPSSGAGEMALTMTQGALRFIGGTLSDAQPALVTTPTATIGIRGSSALISTDGQSTVAVFIAGDELCLTPNGGTGGFCTAQLGGLLTEQGFGGIVSPDVFAQITGQIDQITAADGQNTDLSVINLGAIVPVDVQPFSTAGSQPPQTPPIVLGAPPAPPAPPQQTADTPPEQVPPPEPPAIPDSGNDEGNNPPIIPPIIIPICPPESSECP